jgi:hypothetical protein
MKKYVLLLALSLAACKENQKAAPGAQPFFVFDQVDHYHTAITDAEVKTLYEKPGKKRTDLAMLQIVGGNVPVSGADTVFIRNMDVLGFTEKTLNKSENEKLSVIFSKHDATSPAATPAQPVYRDVLIFRRGGRVVGMAKLDMAAQKSHIIGSRYNTLDFGRAGEFAQLRPLLQP